MTPEDPIQRIALREASFGHAGEFAPIAKGPVFALAALALLAPVMACCLAWRAAKGLVNSIRGAKAA
jgi:hypothetical protein